MAQTFEAELVRVARTVARLQTRKRRLRRELKQIELDLRVERKHLKALAATNAELGPDVAPMRLFGGAVGLRPDGPAPVTRCPHCHVPNSTERATCRACGSPLGTEAAS